MQGVANRSKRLNGLVAFASEVLRFVSVRRPVARDLGTL